MKKYLSILFILALLAPLAPGLRSLGEVGPLAEAGVVARSVGSNIVATGGTITTVVQNGITYKVHTFTSSGTFQVTSGSGKVWYLVVAGGGGSGFSSGGGGGAGGYLTNAAYNYAVVVGSYTVTVGAGGVGFGGPTNGNNSVFDTITATGGGKSGTGGSGLGASGGSGGGGAGTSGTLTGGAGTAEQGFAGGDGYGSPDYNGGGGGGAGAVGQNGSATAGGNGGDGLSSSITGSAVTRGGGGGGNAYTDEGDTDGSGGAGGGGNAPAGNGTANTGGGGGGRHSDSAGGNGGSGVVIIRYALGTTKATTALKNAPIVATGGTITTVTQSSVTRKVHTFTSSGTFSVTSGRGKVWYLVVAGGGGGGGNVGGGGGAGGYRTNNTFTYPVSVGSYTVTIGAGGASATNGNNSVFDTITSTGGGAGGTYNAGNGGTGGSGGGGSAGFPASAGSGGSGTVGQGSAGGNGAVTISGNVNAGGGGGGASAVGGNASADASNSTGGNGGAGTASGISGTSVTYAGGGGGHGDGSSGGGAPGAGGAGGGGTGAITTNVGTAGTANTGGGGGGGGENSPGGGAGGSGVVIVSYVTSKEIVTKAPPAQGLVGWWPFDSAFVTDKIYDRAGRGNHGYFVGGATSTAKVTGKLGKALSFDGVNDYVNIPTISVPSSITVSAWVFSTNFDQSGMIVMKKPVNVQWALFLETNDAVSQGIKWRGNNAVGDEACATASFPSNNQWHHIVATQTGTTCNIYLDGALVKTATVSAIANGTTPGTNDILISTYDGSSYPFNGKIDDVRIYNRALTYAEVLQLYNSR